MPETVLDDISQYRGCEKVKMTIPALPAYVSVVRLAIAAIASRCMFDIESIHQTYHIVS